MHAQTHVSGVCRLETLIRVRGGGKRGRDLLQDTRTRDGRHRFFRPHEPREMAGKHTPRDRDLIIVPLASAE